MFPPNFSSLNLRHILALSRFMLHHVPLGTGSIGSSHLIVAQDAPSAEDARPSRTAILVDAGLQLPELVRRLSKCGVSASEIAAVFVTHEHEVNTRYLSEVMEATGAPLMATRGTLAALAEDMYPGVEPRRLPKWLSEATAIKPHWPVTVGRVTMEAASTVHGEMVGRPATPTPCEEPVAYGVSEAATGARLAIITDTGRPTQSLRRIARHCDALFVETNYDLGILMGRGNPSVSDHYKGFLTSSLGHLSNKLGVQFAADHISPRLKAVVLGNLAEEFNAPSHVLAEGVSVLGAAGFDGCVGISHQDAVGPCVSIAEAGSVVVKPMRATVDRRLTGEEVGAGESPQVELSNLAVHGVTVADQMPEPSVETHARSGPRQAVASGRRGRVRR